MQWCFSKVGTVYSEDVCMSRTLFRTPAFKNEMAPEFDSVLRIKSSTSFPCVGSMGHASGEELLDSAPCFPVVAPAIADAEPPCRFVPLDDDILLPDEPGGSLNWLGLRSSSG